jgi:hypothetical protein
MMRNEKLGDVALRLRNMLKNEATGPLAASAEVVTIAGRWDDDYRAQAEGKSASSWLVATLGKGRTLAWFQARARAAQRIGEWSRTTWHHEAAVWADRKLGSDHDMRKLDQFVQKATVENAGNPLSCAAVRRIARVHKLTQRMNVIGVKDCARCKMLEKRLRDLGDEHDEAAE